MIRIKTIKVDSFNTLKGLDLKTFLSWCLLLSFKNKIPTQSYLCENIEKVVRESGLNPTQSEAKNWIKALA